MGGKKRHLARAANAKSRTTKKGNNGTGDGTAVNQSVHGDTLSSMVFSVMVCALKCTVWFLIAFPFFVATQILSIVFGRPPNMVYFRQTLRYLKFVWKPIATSEHEQHLKPFSVTEKIRFTTTILVHTIYSPLSAFAWILDEIFYGRRLKRLDPRGKAAVENPIFVVSAFRSASTQMARGLIADTQYTSNGNNEPCFVAPNAMMCAYPYLWLWNIVYAIVGDIPDTLADAEQIQAEGGLTKEAVRNRFNSGFTSESLARHANDPFQTDTFDGTFLNCHLNAFVLQLCRGLPSSVIEQEFNYACQKEEDTLNCRIWQKDMVRHIDGLARKTMLFHIDDTTSHPQRFLLKGHFLSICPQLREAYHGKAKFVTVLRDPCARLQSGINYMAVNPTLYGSNPSQQVPWAAFAKSLQETEAQYCEHELEWFKRTEQDRLAVAFDSFVANREKQMEEIVNWLGLLSENDPGKVVIVSSSATKSNKSSRKHNASTASSKNVYRVDRSLAELGIDEKAYKERLRDYLAWMKDVSSGKSKSE